MVGIVIVSHSPRLAEGVAELAREMGGDVRIETAAGIADGSIGTDAVLVAAAIDRAWSPDGVLVLMDLGSAVLSAEMALDLVADAHRTGVLLCEAPIVEGAVAAAVTAKMGATLEQVAAEARNGIAGKVAHLEPEGTSAAAPTITASGRSILLTVEAAHGLHARPAARLVQTAASFDADVRITNVTGERGPVDARSLSAVASLIAREGDQIEVSASGPQAEAALGAFAELAAGRFGDRPQPDPPVPAATAEAAATEDGALSGISGSPGIGIGPARRLVEPMLEVPIERSDDAAAEFRALDAAIEAVRGDIGSRRDALASTGRTEEAAIFDAHLLFLQDDAVLDPTRNSIRAGASAAAAWRDGIAGASGAWSALDDPYLAARAEDLRSVGRQVLAALLGVELPPAGLEAPGVLIAADLAPADAASLGSEVRAVALANGGPTSHAMIVARALGIPAVVGLGVRILDVADGTPVAVDASRALVFVEPTDETVRALEAVRTATETARATARAAALEPAATIDGRRIAVFANITDPDEVVDAIASGAEGVGLFRSEFLFLGRDRLPGIEQQVAAYRRAAEPLDGRPLTVRTLDAGADKPIPALGLAPAENPALGLRGLRLGLARPELLVDQLRALLRVAAGYPIRVMFPMVTTIAEVRAARELLGTARTAEVDARHPVGEPEVGIMIEVPAAALGANHLAPEVDFFSIGTNDLTQYTLAVDRGDPAVAGLTDHFDPTVLELVGRTASAGRTHGRPVAVCGELAADPAAVPLLIGLGVDELSVASAALPLIKAAIRETDARDAETLARAALAARSASEVRALLAR